MYQYTEFDRQFVQQRADQFRDQLERWQAGKLAEDDFRPLRLQNGWYVQRYAPMLRVAVPYGELSSAQLRVLARVAREGISEAELARVKTQWIASTVYERDSVQNQAQELGSNWVQGFPLDAEERLLALLRTVTPEQVQQVAARYFGDDQLTVATLLPQPLDAKAKRTAPAAGATRH